MAFADAKFQQFVEPTLNLAVALSRQGMAVHWLHPREKRPIGDDWQKKPVHTPESLRANYQSGYNLGIRLGEPSKLESGYLHALDMDIRKPEVAQEAIRALRELLPEVDTLPFVISGSGGESRHFYFVCPAAFHSKKVRHSGVKFTDDQGKKHWTWEIELFGTGKQVAAPPSIHPDTGKPYVWGRAIDFDELEMGIGPYVPEATVAAWLGLESAPSPAGAAEDDDEDLLAYTRKQPLGLGEPEIQRTLKTLSIPDYIDDREGWLQVGMALHHETEGSKRGLEIWDAWSKQSDKYDRDNLLERWRSFKGAKTPVRFATLIKMAALVELDSGADETDGFDEDDDLDEMLGAPADKKPEIPDGDDDLSRDDEKPAAAASEDFDREWKSKLDLTADGTIKSTLHNVSLIISNDPRTRGVVRLNTFTGEVVKWRKPRPYRQRRPGAKGTVQLDGPLWEVRDSANGDLWQDGHETAIRAVIEAPVRQGGYGFRVTDRDLAGALNAAATRNSFHPVREFLQGLEWDGRERVDTLFVRYLGAPNTAYTRQIARMFLIAAVARVMSPGHKFDFAVILEGLQGRRKTTFIQILAKRWFAELGGNFDDTKAAVEVMQGAWILELAEMASLSRSDVKTAKAFLSRPRDKVRMAYGRRAKEFPRQCVFMGSTNDKKYLKDDTGGRRFWPIVCEVAAIDTDGLRAEIDDIWAEAFAAYTEMRAAQPHGDLPLYLTDEAAAAEAARAQEDRRPESAEDVLAGQIEAWLNEPLSDGFGFGDQPDELDEMMGNPVPMRNVTCVPEIWVDCLKYDRRALDQRASLTVGQAMQKIPGWRSNSSRPVFPKWGRQRAFTRDGSEESRNGFLDKIFARRG